MDQFLFDDLFGTSAIIWLCFAGICVGLGWNLKFPRHLQDRFFPPCFCHSRGVALLFIGHLQHLFAPLFFCQFRGLTLLFLEPLNNPFERVNRFLFNNLFGISTVIWICFTGICVGLG